MEILPDSQVIIEDKHELLGAFRGSRNNRRYEFVIEGEKLFRSFLTVNIDDAILEVSKTNVELYLQQNEVVEWDYDKNTATLVDKKTDKKLNILALRDNMPRQKGYEDFDIMSFFSTTAYAQEGSFDIDILLDDLASENLRVRKDSRNELIDQGTEIIPILMTKLHSEHENSRIKSEIIYVLSQFYSAEIDNSDAIRAKLSLDDIDLLYKATTETENTVNNHATKFLYSIHDQRTIELCVEQITESQNPEEQYNALLILGSFFAELGKQKQDEILQIFQKVSINFNKRNIAVADYLKLPFFMIRIVTTDDISNKSKWDLDIMRNAIYARYGRKFNRQDLQKYFDEQSWYVPLYTPENFQVPSNFVVDKASLFTGIDRIMNVFKIVAIVPQMSHRLCRFLAISS